MALLIVTIVGAITAFYAATIGLVQNDLKKVIAYSTCSQLGYMIFACGISGYNVSMYHLTNHAFFKALLFLSAGSVIHSMQDEQDMRRMGGLLKVLPFTYSMFLIGSLALLGFPFLSGYYSKDFINAINKELEYSTQVRPKVIAPLINVNKQEIIELAKSINFPFNLIWSCYSNSEKHCGKCESCKRLKRGLERANLFDIVNLLFNTK